MLDLKNLGNEAFKAGKFKEAAEFFTKAIELNPNDHVLYSNRSGAYASMYMYNEALADANKCIELKPDWPKGYSRKGLCEYKLGSPEKAKETYNLGLTYDPNNEALKKALYEVENDKSDTYIQSLLMVSQMIQQNPKLRKYQEQDPEYSSKLARLISHMNTDPAVLQQILTDPNPALRDGLMACIGINEPTEKREAPPEEKPKEPEKTEPKEPLTPSQAESKKYKEEGNNLYKQKKFAEALEMYNKAIELDPNNLLLENNKAAVYLEMGDYEKCIKTCNDAIDRRYDVMADFTLVSKIYNRLAACYTKMEKYDDAISCYQKSLIENNTRQTRSLLSDLERLKERKEKEAYINPELAEQHREKGNEYFKEFKFPEAKKEYDEAIKRNPSDAKLYSNRAAALLKLCEYPSALADCNKAIELDPTFVKAWARKGNLHVLMKEYHKAMDAYDKGLKVDPNNNECLQGRYNCINKIQEMNKGNIDEEQYKHAMSDPEVQEIICDPQFQLILKKISENPTTMGEYLKDPKISHGIQKLMAAGLLTIL
uniref:Hsp70-Hsp90 organising protein n=1 Tax=Theileria annulata TaxID=5874 RepID=A0A3B0MWC7_THEAN